MENRHIECKGDTLATATTDMDNLQIDIETTNKKMIYKDDTGTLHTVANSGEAIDVTDIVCDSLTDDDLTEGRVVIVGVGGLLTDDAALLYDVANNILQSDKFGSPTDTDTYINFIGSNQVRIVLNALNCYAFTQNEFDITYSTDATKYAYFAVDGNGLLTIGSENCGGIKLLPSTGIVYIDYAIIVNDSSGLFLYEDSHKGIEIRDGGYVLMVNQPSFCVYPSAHLFNVTGDGTVYTVAWDTEIRDQSSNFASNTFTAPVTGVYHFDLQINLAGLITATHTSISIGIVTTNRTYTNFNTAVDALTTNKTINISVDADMDAGETATISVTVAGSSKVVDIYGTTDMLSYWSGRLVC
jgi:hypothetical protein